MDAFDDAMQKLQRDLDNLRQLRSRPIPPPNGDGDGDGDGDGPPPPPPFNPNLVIAGIEITQGSQFFNFNGRGTGLAPDNSLPLVPHKPTVIRVYVDRRTTPGFPSPSSVTGSCVIGRREWIPPYPGSGGGGWHYEHFPTPPPINGPIVALPVTQINRGFANHTLNFRLDAWRCTGEMRIYIRIWDATHSTNAGHLQSTPWFSFGPPNFPFDYIEPRVRAVPITYTGPDPTTGNPTPPGPGNPPSTLEVDKSLVNSFVTKVFPISQISITGYTPTTFDGDLRVDGSAGCGEGWNALITRLENLRSASSTGDVYVGVLPSGVPLSGSPSGGCGSDGVAAALVGDQVTMAHEIGHAYGRNHAPTQPTQINPAPAPPICTSPSDVDPSYPTYTLTDGTVLPSGSIGESGFDTTTSQVHNPGTTFDFMGYCPDPNLWVSPYTWQNLYAYFTSIHWIVTGIGTAVGPASGTAAFASEAPPLAGEYLILNFRMHREGEVELSPSFHLVGVALVPPSAEEAPVVLEPRAADGRVVGSHRCHLTNHNFDPSSPYRDFHEVLPWVPETTSIAFLRDGDELQTLEVEERAPQITSRPVAEREGARVRLAWEAQHDENSITYLVRYSNDGGNTWLAVAAGLTEPGFVADLADLPGGERCVFQIAASSTIRTTVAQTSAMAVPVKPRRPNILSPEPNSTFFPGEPVVLGGVGFSPDFETAPFDEVVWTSNVEGFLGYGYEVITQTLTPGLHKITLGVADGLGGEAAASLLLKIHPRGQPMVQPMD